MRPVILTERAVLLCGDSKTLALGEGSVDAVVCDPPYELGFMGKKWDASGVAYDVELWRAVFRVLKPGGHLLAFGGTRTYHRMACAIEDAGFDIRDSLHWIYGSGFPKSLTSKSAEIPASTGTALKPAHEPIILARKPHTSTVAANLAEHGTGVLQIEACRIGTSDAWNPSTRDPSNSIGTFKTNERTTEQHALGRWPANFVLSHLETCEIVGQDEVVRMVGAFVDAPFDREGTVYDGGWEQSRTVVPTTAVEDVYRCATGCPVGELGEKARFFYCSKPSGRERDFGCEGLPVKSGGEATDREDGSAGLNSPRAGAGRKGGRRNVHPTVKPIELMRWLCRLVTPPGGVVLDPFTGSGTTGIAALREGLSFIGVEQSDEYAAIAAARIQKALEESKP